MFRHCHRSIVTVTLISFLAGQIVPTVAAQPRPIAQVRAVPSVLGLDADVAKAKLEDARFAVRFEIGKAAPSPDEHYVVYEQTPRVGTRLELGRIVTLRLYDKFSDLPADTTGRVPSVFQMTAKETKGVLEKAGFGVEFEVGSAAPSPEHAFKAYRQTPAAGERLASGQTVRVVLYDDVSGAGTAHRELSSVRPVPRPEIDLETVDAASGTLISSSMDLAIPAGPTTITLVRYLRKEIGSSGMLGLCWRTNWEKRVLHNDHVAVIEEAISRTVFQIESSGHYRSSFGDLLVIEASGARRLRADGSQEVFDADGRLVRVLEPGGTQIRVHYDTQERLVSVDGPFGSFLRFNYGTNGQVNLVTSSEGATITYTYGPLDDTHREPGTFTYKYDASLRLVSSYDPARGVVEYAYDDQNRVVQRRDAAGGSDRYKFDDASNSVSHTNAVGDVTRILTSADGRRQTTIDPRGGQTLVERDAAGRPVRIQPKSREAVAFKYDRVGRVATVELGTVGSVEYEYDPATHLPVAVTYQGKRTQLEYDSSQRLTGIAVGEKDPRPLQIAYRPDGLVKSIQRGSNLEAEYEYDVRGRRIAETDAYGNVVRSEYDRFGNEVRRRGPLGQDLQREFDKFGHVVSETDSLGNRTTYAYNERGMLTETTNPLGHVSRALYSATGETSEFTAFNGDRAKFAYDAAGRVAAVTRPSGGVVNFEYDAGGDVAKTTGPLGNTRRIEYNAAGQIVRQIDAKGQTTRFEYDKSGRFVRQIRSDGVEITNSYDDRGRLIRVDDDKFPVLYEYDARDNVTQISYPAINRTLIYEYDELNRLIEFTDSEGRQIGYEYDAADRLTSIQLPGGRTISLTHDARDRLTEVVLPGKTKGQFVYDAEDHITALTWDSLDGTLAAWQYEYDANGRRASVIGEDTSSVAYSYDPSGQLLQESRDGDSQRFEYGPGGNRLRSHCSGQTIHYEHDAADRLVRAGDESFRYDENGNLVERDGPQGKTTYHWDAANQLVQVVLPDGGQVKYGYAPTGERVWREDADGRMYFVTDGVNLLAELDGQFNPTASYVHLPGIDRPVVMTRGDKEFALLADERGSIRCITDADGKAVAAFDYDAFGASRHEDQPLKCPFGHAAREFDSATGLYYYRARWYDPQLGRFLSADPEPGRITQPLSLHPYVFTWNDPVNLSDPLGLDPNVPSHKRPTRALRPPPKPILPGGSGISVPAPPAPTAAQRAASGIAGMGGAGNIARTGALGAAITAPLWAYQIEQEVKNVPTPDKPHVRATGWGSFLGNVGGGTGGMLGGAALSGLLGLTPAGWGALALTGLGTLVGGLIGGKVGGKVGGALVPPGTHGGRQRPYKDARDFMHPSGVTKPPDKTDVAHSFPPFDPKQFVKPGTADARTRYAVLAICSKCSAVHNGGIFTTREAAERAANQSFSDPKYRVTIRAVGVPNN